MEALADLMVLAMIALSCHFALDILCDKSETRKCIDTATFDLLQDGTDVTSDEQRKTLGAVSYTVAPTPGVAPWKSSAPCPLLEGSQTVQRFRLRRTVSHAL